MKNVKRALSVILTVIMVLSSAAAGLSVIASAADWTYVEGTTYEPVYIYKNVSGSNMVNGRTYRLGVYYYNTVLTVSSSGAVSLSAADTPLRTQPELYTSNDGSDVLLQTTDYYTEEDLGSDFVWQNGTLYNPDSGKYLVNNGTSALTTSGTSVTWTFSSDHLYRTVSSRTRYIRNSSNNVVLGTSNSNNYIYLYEKTAAYKKTSSGEGGYYKYNGPTEYTVDLGSSFNEALVLNNISVLHKTDKNTADADADVLTINDEAITFSWDKAVDTSKEGVYTGTVYADGKAIQTISVYVENGAETGGGKADPSTSKIEDRFSLTHADDGRIETDKTVQYGKDEFGAFNSYDDNEFSVALSTLGQAYDAVETEEATYFEKTHPDVVFVIDASGSMRVYNVAGDGSTSVSRAQATAEGLNAAIKELYAEDPETRIGIVTFGYGVDDGVYLPLDKYTLPEGQEDYITWNGMMVASQQSASDISGIVSKVTPVVSGAVTATTYFYPTNKASSTTNTTSLLRYQINTSGRVRRYAANSTSYTTLSSALASGSYVEDTANGYVIYRNGNNYYVYTKADFDNYKASLNGSSNLAYDVKTVASSGTLSSIKTISKWPGYQKENNVWSYYKPSVSEMTKIATTASGKTYYVVVNGDVTFIFDDESPMAVAFMAYNSSTYSYSSTFVTDEISVELTSASSLKYTTYTYEKETGTTLSFENHEYVMATNFLINSNGEIVKPSSHHFVVGVGTYTQSGLQAAENMFRETGNKENRVPALVLLSDGIPTVSDTNVNNPQLMMKVGTTVGYGLSTATDEVNSQFLCNHGLRTIETAMKAKKNINNMYASSNNREGLFYTIGPGVDYIFGKTILDPTNENIAAAAKQTTNVGENTESGVGVPSDLAATISAKYSDLDYVDYADWSFTGDMSSSELTTAFKKIVTSILDTTRPVTVTPGTTATEEIPGAMTFTDVIGDGMMLSSEPVVRYANNNYAPTGKTTTTLSDGSTVTSYEYDYRVNEESTKTAYNLKGLKITVTTAPDGKQTVKWYIPVELVPIIVYDGFEETYIRVSPIRLVYKVKLDESKAEESGKYYTNSIEEPANVEYTPAVGNPYYYDNKTGSDGKMHSTLKENLDKSTSKTTNITETDPDSNDTTVDNNGKVTTELGNNGVVEINVTEITITKVWDDGKNVSGSRPENIKVQLYRNGRVYGEEKTISAQNSKVGTAADGNDTWTYTIKGLPYSEDFVYSVIEVSVDGYTTEMKNDGNSYTITNSAEKTKLSYDLYLVDRDGNPINENGEKVSFEDRVVKSELKEFEQYVNTTETIDIDEIEKLLPEGYIVYNPDTSFTQTYNGKDADNNSASVKDDKAGTTKVVTPETATINSDGSVTGIGDCSNTHVTFAIVKIEIIPDVIVVDYGKTILCSPLDNDTGAINLIGLGALDGNSYKDSFTSQNGVFRTEGDNVTFSPFSYMSSINRVKYYANVRNSNNGTQILNSTISVIPATTVYYEDDFGGSEENGGLYIKYTGSWMSVDDSGNKIQMSANTNLNDRQDRGEVGQGHVPYGYDSSYSDDVKFSNGTAAVVKGSISKDANGKNQFDAYAEFTFTGTGFDIISRTDMDCGTITVAVYDVDNELIANVPVINKGVENLYQIPVISFTGLSYDTYRVKINVNAPQKLLGITGSTFYLDAIRIYDPMGLSNRDNAEFDEAYEAYYKDKESNAFIGSIRDYILSIEDLGVDEEAGAVYVDTINNDYTGGGVLNKDQLEDFHISGPNEEVYLTPGKGVGFALVCSALPSSVQLEIKIPAPLSNEANLLAQTNGKPDSRTEIKVQSAAEMFYDITEAVQFVTVQKASGTYYRAVVVLSNGLAGAENDIVSITNVKLTYPESVRNIVEGKDEDKIITSGETSTIIDESGEIIEAPTEVAVGVMASWNIYCETFDTVYTQHKSSVPSYNVATDISDMIVTAQGQKVTATFTTTQYVDDLVITDADGKNINAEVTSVLDEDNLYTASYESAKVWTVTFDNAVGIYNLTVAAANGEGKTAEITVNVKPVEAVSLSVLKAPAKTQYSYGDEIDSSGLELLVTYSDGTTRVVKSGYTLSTYKADKSGKRSVTVNYNGLQTSYQINVKMTFAQVILTIFGFGWLLKK